MSELGALFQGVLKEVIGTTAAVFDYGNPEHFAQLWGTDAKGTPTVLADVNGKKAIIIVWDGRTRADSEGNPIDDPGAGLLVFHLTPLDWALAFSIKVLGDPAFHAQCNFSIHIVDLTGKAHDDEWALRMRFQLLSEMPWVTLHAPLRLERDGEVAGYRKAYRPIVEEKGLVKQNETGWTLELGTPISRSATTKCHDRLKYLAKQWSASLTASDDHHDMNNAFGPCLLLPQSKTAMSQDAFRTRLAWMGLFVAKPQGNLTPLNLEKDFDGPFDVLLVDDQIEPDWGDLICTVFGRAKEQAATKDRFSRLDTGDGSGNCRIFGASSATPLIEKLQSVDFSKRDYGFCFGIGENIREVILLDLRMYSGEASKAFYKQLLEIAKKTRVPSSAWPAISEEECERIQQWLEQPTPSGDDFYSAITLLGRLLALAAPLTPIIIFSSTGRSKLKEKFKDYRNIITAFEKPRPLSESGSVADALDKLQGAVKYGLAMLAFRTRLQWVAQIERQAERQRPKECSQRHYEIYFDESDDGGEGKDFTYAGALFAFDSINNADELQNICLEEFKKVDGKIWAKNISLTAQTRLKKFTGYKSTPAFTLGVSNISELINRFVSNDSCYVVAAKRRGYDDFSEGGLLQCGFRDQQMDALVRFVVEYGLLILPKFLKQAVVSAGLYFDVRSAEFLYNKKQYSAYITAREEAKNEALAFGLSLTSNWVLNETQFEEANSKKKTIHIKVYDENSFFPLVTSILARWPADKKNTNVVAIRGVQLSHGTGNGIEPDKANQRRLIHDIADWVAGCVRSGSADHKNAMYPIVAEDKWHVADQSSSGGVMPLMNAIRTFAHGNRGEGLWHMMTSSLFNSMKADTPMVQVMCWSCGQFIRDAMGSDLFYAMDTHYARLRETEDISPGSRVEHDGRSTGTVKMFNKEKCYGFIASSDGGANMFMHRTAIEGGGFNNLKVGQTVSYEVEMGPNNRPQATRVRVEP